MPLLWVEGIGDESSEAKENVAVSRARKARESAQLMLEVNAGDAHEEVAAVAVTPGDVSPASGTAVATGAMLLAPGFHVYRCPVSSPCD